MGAPTPSNRSAPDGIMMEQGYQSLIVFGSKTDLEFYEKSITPPKASVGDKIGQSTQHNVRYKTFAGPSLIEIGETQVTAGYDPIMYTRAREYLGVPDTITVIWPDGTRLAYYGYLQSIEPGAMAEGQPVEMTLVFVATNVDPSDKSEQGPVLDNVSGT